MKVKQLNKAERNLYQDYRSTMQDAGLEPAFTAEEWVANYRAARARLNRGSEYRPIQEGAK
jgi:hypothetical protein